MAGMDNARALLVGIASYQAVNPLPTTVLKDAQDVYNTLIDPTQCGYKKENVRLLLDKQATREVFCQALHDLAAGCDAEANVFIYLSCHGGQITSGPHAGEYILPVDVDYRSDVYVAETAVSSAEFSAALREIPARKVTVVFDCCHAGGIGQPKDAAAPAVKGGLPDSYYDRLKQGRGRAILASSRSDEQSWVMPGAANSLFTQHLLAGLKGGIASDDGLIRIFDLFEYVQPKVTLDQPNQHPIFKAEIEENFPVSLYLGGQKGVVPQVEPGFRYDAYISYVDREPDAAWVWDTLVPKLEAAGLQIAVSDDVAAPGVARVVNVERGIRQARRTVVVLSNAYLADHGTDFENTLAQTMGIQEGAYRLLPIAIEAIDPGQLPVRLGMLTTLNMTHPRRAEREFQRLIQALQGPLPRR